jgi:hypothetical protein
MVDPAILECMEMDPEELGSMLAAENPPLAAVQAAAVLEFMNAFHLTDRKDGIEQYVRFRKSQAESLGLKGEERKRFMDGFGPDGE